MALQTAKLMLRAQYFRVAMAECPWKGLDVHLSGGHPK